MKLMNILLAAYFLTAPLAIGGTAIALHDHYTKTNELNAALEGEYKHEQRLQTCFFYHQQYTIACPEAQGI